MIRDVRGRDAAPLEKHRPPMHRPLEPPIFNNRVCGVAGILKSD
jgi:hypothetical protein